MIVWGFVGYALRIIEHPQATTTDTRSARATDRRTNIHSTIASHSTERPPRSPGSALGLRPDPVRPIEIRPKERHILVSSPSYSRFSRTPLCTDERGT